MAKKAIARDQIVKLIVGAGQASPSPPVGPALGSKGVKSMDFCKVSHLAIVHDRNAGSLSHPFQEIPTIKHHRSAQLSPSSVQQHHPLTRFPLLSRNSTPAPPTTSPAPRCPRA